MQVSLGHTSQNGQKLDDQINRLLGDDGSYFYEQDFDEECPVMYRRSAGPPRRSPRTNSISIGHTNSIRRELFSTGESLQESNPLMKSKHKNGWSSSHRVSQSPESTPGKTTGSSNQDTPTTVTSKDADLPEHQDGVTVIENDDGLNETIPSKVVIPTQEQSLHCQRLAAKRQAESRKPKTKLLYGNVTDPSKSTGYIGGFYRWCVAGPNEEVDGRKTDSTKKKYSCVPSSAICHEYFSTHFLLRPQWNAKERSFSTDTTVGSAAISNCIKALCALYDHQSRCYEGGPDGYKKKFGARPNSNRELSNLKQSHGATTADERQKKHLPRGKSCLNLEGYTRDQNRQLFEFGMTNEWIEKLKDTRLGKDRTKCRVVRTHHSLSHNFLLRFDDRQKLRLSDWCCIDAPEEWGGDSKLLTCVTDGRKMNRDGKFESCFAARHHSDPLRCSFFTWANELYCQIHINGLDLTVEDFIPQERPGNMHHYAWYDRYFLVGNSKSQKGVASRPDPTKKCNYDNINSGFKTLYELIEPVIRGYHVLHLQRGTSARMANASGVELHEIANMGCWKAVSALLNNYLTGVPIKFVGWIAGWPKDIDPKDPPVVLRNLLQPPEVLWTKVFPFYLEVKALLEEDKGKNPEDRTFPTHKDVTILGFMELCEVAAKYFVQDCAILYETMSNHEIFSTELFQSPEFFSFREGLLQSIRDHVAANQDKKKAASANQEEMLDLVRKCYQILTNAGVESVIAENDLAVINSPTVERALQAIVTPEATTEGTTEGPTRSRKNNFFSARSAR